MAYFLQKYFFLLCKKIILCPWISMLRYWGHIFLYENKFWYSFFFFYDPSIDNRFSWFNSLFENIVVFFYIYESDTLKSFPLSYNQTIVLHAIYNVSLISLISRSCVLTKNIFSWKSSVNVKWLMFYLSVFSSVDDDILRSVVVVTYLKKKKTASL